MLWGQEPHFRALCVWLCCFWDTMLDVYGAAHFLQVVVHNIPWTTTWQQLKDMFKEWKVERADVVYDTWGKSR